MAHLTVELVYFTSVSINDPSWSVALEMLKVESTPATVRASRDIAMWFPGHILIDHFSTSRDRWRKERPSSQDRLAFDQTQMPSMQDLGCWDQAGRSSETVRAWKMMDQDSRIRYWASPCIEMANLVIISNWKTSYSYQTFGTTIDFFGMK